MKYKIRVKKEGKSNREKKELSKPDRFYRKIIEYGILGVIVFSPLPKASVPEWSILVIQLTVLVMLAAYILMKEKPQSNELLSRSMKWSRYLFIGFFVFVFIQVLPWPKLLVRLLSPNSYHFRELFSVDISKIKFISFSLVPSQTLKEGLELLAYFLLGFLVIKTVTKRRQIMKIFYVLVAMGVFQAFYGFYELFNKNPRILFFEKIYNLDSVTGTFVNRNHLSGFLEMIIPLSVGLIIARVDLFSLAGLKWREKILRISERGFYKNLLLSFGMIIMSLAIVFSKSRSGIFLIIFTFILFFGSTVFYIGRKKRHEKWMRTFFSVVFLVIILFSLFIGIDTVIERFALDEVLNEYRPIFWSNTYQIIKDFPLLGSGLGTFASVYPSYETIQTELHLSHVHNDYLEYLSEVGAIGMLLLLGGILFMLIHSFLIWRVRRHPEVKGLALGGMIAIVCILFHCIVDFNLHIPANTLVFTIVLSLMMVTAFYKRNEATQSDEMSKARIVSRDMKNLRRALLIIGVVALMIVNIFIYRSQYLFDKAKRTEEIEEKITILHKANEFYPINDLVFYELGKNYFDLGIRSLEEDSVLGKDYLQKAAQNFVASIRLNPASRFCHFYYAQSLLYMSYLFPSQGVSSFEEYKKAALLAGHNSEIFFEVGKIFLSQWPNLGNEEKEFTIESLKKIARGDNEIRLQTVMHIWMMNVKDYAVMQEILPEDIQTYRTYAKFLGEMSLSLKERQKVLADAEYLEFERAQTEYELGESEFMYFRVKKASQHFRSCLDRLDRIHFYQNLIDQKLIDLSEYYELRKQAYLKLVKCHLREGRELKDVEAYLREYIELEDSSATIAKLESYLKDLGLISASLDDDLGDLGLLAFQILLYFKQNRYMDIVKVGNTLQKGYIFVPEYEKEEYVEVLRRIGDSYYRINYLYDAVNFYNKALEVDPESLEILWGLALVYERLSNDRELQKINEKIERILSQKETESQNILIERGESFSQRVLLEGRKIILNLHLKSMEDEVAPWVSVFLNGAVVWEDYTMAEMLSIPLEPNPGENTLRVASGNTSINLIDFEYMDEE